jgi:hypothetical protein
MRIYYLTYKAPESGFGLGLEAGENPRKLEMICYVDEVNIMNILQSLYGKSTEFIKIKF